MIRTRRENNANKAVTGINITPFTDVCLVLLIIFLLTATDLNQRPDQGINITAPTADNSEMMPSAPIIIEMDKNQNIYLNTELVRFEDLKDRLIDIYAKQPNLAPQDKIVIIRADRLLPYDTVMKLMDIAAGAGSANIVLGTEDDSLPELE